MNFACSSLFEEASSAALEPTEDPPSAFPSCRSFSRYSRWSAQLSAYRTFKSPCLISVVKVDSRLS